MNIYSSAQVCGSVGNVEIRRDENGAVFVTVESEFSRITMEPKHVRAIFFALDAWEATAGAEVPA
jgi:hypothetical protein